jgi:hypothetical protein
LLLLPFPSLFETGHTRMTKRQARPYAAPSPSSPAARPASPAKAETNPRPFKHDPSAMAALPLFSMFFLGAWTGKPGAARGRKR